MVQMGSLDLVELVGDDAGVTPVLVLAGAAPVVGAAVAGPLVERVPVDYAHVFTFGVGQEPYRPWKGNSTLFFIYLGEGL